MKSDQAAVGNLTPGVEPWEAVAGRFALLGRVAVVTGASSGLGAHFARVLHAAGARVVVAARRKNRLAGLAEELPGLSCVPVDLSLETERERLIAHVLDDFGRVDVLVNNAGAGHVAALADETVDQFRSVLELNVTAMWHLAKLVGPSMTRRRSGSIINISSVLGLVASYPIAQANYAASKGAVINLTRELALQLATSGVRVNSLCPGWFPTEMTEVMHEESGQRFIRRNTPLKRMGELCELSGPLLLLASDAGSFMTGHTLVVDGGWTSR